MLLIAGLAFLAVGAYYDHLQAGLYAQILISLGFLAAGLGSTILLYLRRVGVHVSASVESNNRFVVRISDGLGGIELGSEASHREIRIAPRSGPVLFFRLIGGIFLEVHRFASRKEASRKFLKMQSMQEGTVLPAKERGSPTTIDKKAMNAFSIRDSEKAILWRDWASLEVCIPLTLFLSGMLMLVFQGLEIPLSWDQRSLIVTVLFSVILLISLISTSVHLIVWQNGKLVQGRLWLRFWPSRVSRVPERSSVLSRLSTALPVGRLELWRQDSLPTAEVRLFENRQSEKPLRRIRLHSSLAVSLRLYRALQSFAPRG